MARPALNDTIVAIASGRRASAVGIVRLTGPQAFAFLSRVVEQDVASQPPIRTVWPRIRTVRIAFDEPGGFQYCIPARLLEFRAPKSYTGQDLVEIHVPGALPLLDALVEALVRIGARQATAGEFTARSFLNGKIDQRGVEDTLLLIRAQSATEASQAARNERSIQRKRIGELKQRILDLLARVEAGIDFVDEEDVQFISPAEARREIGLCIDELITCGGGAGRLLPHIVLIGLPNAGKSTLFNAIIGSQRAIVAPLAGTTRDIVSCEVEFGGVAALLQDTAGQGFAISALDCTASDVAREAARAADLVVFVHDGSRDWDDQEAKLLRDQSSERLIVVYTKSDLPASTNAIASSSPFEIASVCAYRLDTIHMLRDKVSKALQKLGGQSQAPGLADVRRNLEDALQVIAQKSEIFFQPELIAVELRSAAESLHLETDLATDEQILERVFKQFCIGK